MGSPPFADVAVAAVFAAYPAAVASRLRDLRALIFEVAHRTPGVGALTETLKWGQPAYRPLRARTGATLRIDALKSGGYALYVPCQTSLVATWRDLYPGVLRFEGQRAVLFTAGEPPPAALEHCIALALTYHAAKKRHERRSPTVGC